MRACLRSAVLLSVLGLASCVAPPPPANSAEACALSKLADFPLTNMFGLPTVMVSIDGNLVRLALDTGSSGTVLFSATAERLKLATDWANGHSVQGTNGVSVMHDLLPQEFQIGTFKAGKYPIGVVPSGPRPAIDGLIGNDVLEQFDIEYDGPRQYVTLYRRRDCASGAPPWSAPFRGVAITYVPGVVRLVGVPAFVGSRATSAILDTGAASSFMTVQAAEASGVPASVLDNDPVVNMSGLGTERVRIVRHQFPDVTIAGEQFHDRSIAVRAQSSVVTTMGNTFKDEMNIGQDWLRTRRIWLSYASQRLYIAPGSPAAAK